MRMQPGSTYAKPSVFMNARPMVTLTFGSWIGWIGSGKALRYYMLANEVLRDRFNWYFFVVHGTSPSLRHLIIREII